MKKIVATFMMLNLCNAYSIEQIDMDKIAAERAEWTRKHFEAEGAPVPDGGIKIVPETQLSHYDEYKEIRAKNDADVKKYGYSKDSSPDIQSLLNFKRIAASEFQKGTFSLDPKSEHLRHNINELKMGYTFNAVPQAQMSTLLGVSPYLNYIDNQGWVGAAEYFENKSIGVCEYKENNTKLSHGSVIIAQEEVRYDINGKVTTVDVRGNEGVGFIYNVEWYDPIFFRQLECATPKYDSEITQKVIQLAIQIDQAAK